MCGTARSAKSGGPEFGNPLHDLQTVSQVRSEDRQQFVEDARYGEAGLTSDLTRDLVTGTNYQDRLKIKNEREQSKGDTRLQRSDQLGSSIGGQDSNINY
tara:strand:+ start:866 stop:1165 length:300 start_codon:yes stop_codon:yes gene_type:complete